MDFKSESIGQKLLFIIYLQIGCVFITSVGNILELVKPGLYEKNSIGFVLCAIILMVLILILLVMVPTWIYRVHKDMCSMFSDYPITPKDSLKMTLIPFYNVWGFWKMCKSLYTMFKFHGLQLKVGPFDLQSLYIFAMVLGGIDNQMTKYSFGEGHQGLLLENKLQFEIAAFIVTILSTIIWYGIVKLVTEGMKKLHKEMKPVDS